MWAQRAQLSGSGGWRDEAALRLQASRGGHSHASAQLPPPAGSRPLLQPRAVALPLLPCTHQGAAVVWCPGWRGSRGQAPSLSPCNVNTATVCSKQPWNLFPQILGCLSSSGAVPTGLTCQTAPPEGLRGSRQPESSPSCWAASGHSEGWAGKQEPSHLLPE